MIQDGCNEFIVVGHFTVKIRFVVCGLHTKIVYNKSLHTSQVAHQVRLEISPFLKHKVTRSISTDPLMCCLSIAGLPPSIKFVGTHLYTWVERGTVRVKRLSQELKTMSLPGLKNRPPEGTCIYWPIMQSSLSKACHKHN